MGSRQPAAAAARAPRACTCARPPVTQPTASSSASSAACAPAGRQRERLAPPPPPPRRCRPMALSSVAARASGLHGTRAPWGPRLRARGRVRHRWAARRGATPRAARPARARAARAARPTPRPPAPAPSSGPHAAAPNFATRISRCPPPPRPLVGARAAPGAGCSPAAPQLRWVPSAPAPAGREPPRHKVALARVSPVCRTGARAAAPGRVEFRLVRVAGDRSRDLVRCLLVIRVYGCGARCGH